MNNQNSAKRSLSLSWIIIFLAAFIIIISFAIYAPIRQSISGQINNLLGLLKKSSILDLRICLCHQEKDIKIKRDDGLIISGSLYGLSDNEAKHPGIILIHGNTPLGRKLPVYKVLATKLAEKEYLVLTIDRAGYGESGDPFQLGTLDAFALDQDKTVYAALQYLNSITNLDPDRVYLMGHSGGVPSALSVGRKDDRVKKIVAMGPPRRVDERFNDPKDRDYFWRRDIQTRQLLGHGPFPEWFTQEVWLKQKLSYSDIGVYLDYLSGTHHKPLLLMDGELESEQDKKYLAQYLEQISEPKHYITIPNSDHYCNTIKIVGINVYNQRVIGYTVDSIDRWLKRG